LPHPTTHSSARRRTAAHSGPFLASLRASWSWRISCTRIGQRAARATHHKYQLTTVLHEIR
jgi:hypothetical protein